MIAKARSEGLSKDDNFPHLVSGDDPKIVDKPPTIFHLDPKADARHRLSVERVLAAYRKGLNPDRLRLLDRFIDEGPCIQGGRRRLRWYVLLRRTVSDRRQRTAVPSDQAGAAIRAGAARRQT